MAALWHAAWHSAHAALVPPALLPHRGPDHFRERTRRRLPAMWVAAPGGRVAGFILWTLGYIDLLFVDPACHRRGIGGALLAKAEDEMARAGNLLASLDCVKGNTRAIRFYERHGWHFVEDGFETVEIPAGPVELPSLIYRKALG